MSGPDPLSRQIERAVLIVLVVVVIAAMLVPFVLLALAW